MIAVLSFAVMGVGLLLTLWTAVSAARHRPTGEVQMALGIAVEVALLVQSLIAWLRMPGADIAEPVTFVAYSIGILFPVPLGFQLARLERTRWGSVCLSFATIVVTVMTLRLAAMWGLIGG